MVISLIPQTFTHEFKELPKHCGYLDVPLHFQTRNYKYSQFESKITDKTNPLCPHCPNPEFYKFNKYDIKIKSHIPTESLAADLYIPLQNDNVKNKQQQQEQMSKTPIIIICHGIGSCRDMSLWRYAMFLCSEYKYCILDFDYLSFGESEGYPRQFISPTRHCKDVLAVVNSIAELSKQYKAIDSDNIILFGMSYGGGHVLSVAGGTELYKLNINTKQHNNNNNNNVRCIIASVPYIGAIPKEYVSQYKKLHASEMGNGITNDKNDKKTDEDEEDKEDNSEVKKRTFKQLFYGVYGAVADQLGSIIGLGPRYGRLYGSSELGELAINYYETFGGSEEEFKKTRIKTFRGDMRNAFLLRGLFDMIFYNPSKYLKNINLPILFAYSEIDNLCPGYKVGYALDQVKSKNQCEKLLFDCDHFESTQWKYVLQVSPKYHQFIQKHLA